MHQAEGGGMTRTQAYIVLGTYCLWWYWIIKVWYAMIILPEFDQNANNMQLLCMFCYIVFRYLGPRKQ
jgi:hypothetical protein